MFLPIRDRIAFRTADGWNSQGQGTWGPFRSAEAVDRTPGGRATGQVKGRSIDQGVDGRRWAFKGHRLSLPEPGSQLSHLVTTKDRK